MIFLVDGTIMGHRMYLFVSVEKLSSSSFFTSLNICLSIFNLSAHKEYVKRM